MGVNINFNDPLPDEYEREMSSSLSPIERFDWRKHKFGELRMKGLVEIDDNGDCIFLSESEKVKEPEAPRVKSRPSKPKQVKAASVKTSKGNAAKSDEDYEFIHHMPTSVMDALRRIFPSSVSKADLISAAVYIVTNGDCVISDKAMALVDAFNSNDELISINERLAHLERIVKRQSEMLQSIELCVCFNTFDRRYGSEQSRTSPKQTEFRERGNLDMLERLREQAKDQLKIDEQARGRQIYNQIKDKND